MFIVLGNIKLNEIKYARKSIYHVFLVTAYAAQCPRDGFSHPHQEHMKDTYIPTRQLMRKSFSHMQESRAITRLLLYYVMEWRVFKL